MSYVALFRSKFKRSHAGLCYGMHAVIKVKFSVWLMCFLIVPVAEAELKQDLGRILNLSYRQTVKSYFMVLTMSSTDFKIL